MLHCMAQKLISSPLLMAAITLGLQGCLARYHPPVVPAPEVAPNTPLLWPQNDLPVAEVEDQGDERLGINLGIIAVVEDQPITLKEFDGAFFTALKRKPWNVTEKELYNQVLDNMIEHKVLLKFIQGVEGFEVAEEVIDKKIEDIVKGHPGGWEAYRRMLEKEMISLQDIRDQIRERESLNAARAELMRGMGGPSPRAVRDEYQRRIAEFSQPEERDLGMITIFMDVYKNDKAKGRELVKKVQDRLKKHSFADVARTFSDGAKAKDGGRQGWVKEGDLAEPITKVAFAMEGGQTSGPHRMGDLLFFLHCYEIKEAGSLPFETVQEKLYQELFGRMRHENMESSLKSLKAKSFIRRLSPEDYLRYRQEINR